MPCSVILSTLQCRAVGYSQGTCTAYTVTGAHFAQAAAHLPQQQTQVHAHGVPERGLSHTSKSKTMESRYAAQRQHSKPRKVECKVFFLKSLLQSKYYNKRLTL